MVKSTLASEAQSIGLTKKVDYSQNFVLPQGLIFHLEINNFQTSLQNFSNNTWGTLGNPGEPCLTLWEPWGSWGTLGNPLGNPEKSLIVVLKFYMNPLNSSMFLHGLHGPPWSSMVLHVPPCSSMVLHGKKCDPF